MTMIRVIAAVVDTKRLQLYKEDGKTIEIQQGDPRLAGVVEAAEPLANPVAFKLPKNANGSYYLDIDVPDRDNPKDNTIADYEKQAGGFTKFFRVAKRKVKDFFGALAEEEPVPVVAPKTLGNPVIPAQAPMPEIKDSTGIAVGGTPQEKPFEVDPRYAIQPKEDERKDPKISAAIKDIMANAEPVSEPTFDVDDTKNDETIIAVTDNGNGEAVIVPDVHNLKNYMAAAAKSGNTKGFQAFLARLGNMGKTRNHTVEELLRFMERGDLPLADDGTIIAYKVLRSTPKNSNGPRLAPGEYVDCYTGKVVQRVGSYVCQSEKIIDGSRTECSTGLHIARRGYLGGFSGDIITMVKVKPEDVVSVPGYDANKMRAAGYHIIGLVPKDEHMRLRSNEQMKGTNALKLLTMAIEGDHIDVTEIVEITSPSGGSFTVTKVAGAKGIKPQLKKETAAAAIVTEVPKVEKNKLDAAPIDPKAQAKKVTEVKQLTVADRARALFDAKDFTALIAFKKKAKKGWDKLGFTPSETDTILGSGTAPAAKTPATETRVLVEGSDGLAKTKKKEDKPVAVSLTGTRAEVARILYDQATGTGSATGQKPDKTRWGTLWQHRKECKKSWEILGFNAKEVERIKLNKPDHV